MLKTKAKLKLNAQRIRLLAGQELKQIRGGTGATFFCETADCHVEPGSETAWGHNCSS